MARTKNPQTFAIVRIVREEVASIETDPFGDKSLTVASFEAIAKDVETNGPGEFEAIGLRVTVDSLDA